MQKPLKKKKEVHKEHRFSRIGRQYIETIDQTGRRRKTETTQEENTENIVLQG
jgi:hypothetical protein